MNIILPLFTLIIFNLTAVGADSKDVLECWPSAKTMDGVDITSTLKMRDTYKVDERVPNTENKITIPLKEVRKNKMYGSINKNWFSPAFKGEMEFDLVLTISEKSGLQGFSLLLTHVNYPSKDKRSEWSSAFAGFPLLDKKQSSVEMALGSHNGNLKNFSIECQVGSAK